MLWATSGQPQKMTKSQMIPSGFEYANLVEELQSVKNTNEKKQSTKMKVVLKDLSDEKFIEQVLALFNPKIKEHVVHKLEDVAPDGHCGFRACAELLGKNNDDGWKDVRRSMLDELMEHRESYTYQLGGEKNYKVVEKGLDYFSEYGCGKKYWMQFPEMGLLFASTFNCVFCVLSPLQSCTYLPWRTGPTTNFQIIPIILYDDSHFMKIFLKQNAPIPKVVPWWYKIRSEDASNWEVLVNPMINDWEDRVGCP